MSHKDAPPETPSQTACREWWTKAQPHVTRAWGRAQDGSFLAEHSRLLHKAWEAAQKHLALEVFRIAGGDTECEPNPRPERALEVLRDLRACYDEAIATPSGEVVAWQYRCEDPEDGWGPWADIPPEHVHLLKGKPGCEVRPLVVGVSNATS